MVETWWNHQSILGTIWSNAKNPSIFFSKICAQANMYLHSTLGPWITLFSSLRKIGRIAQLEENILRNKWLTVLKDGCEMPYSLHCRHMSNSLRFHISLLQQASNVPQRVKYQKIAIYGSCKQGCKPYVYRNPKTVPFKKI